jgi:Tfp pilus assembly protein PilO
MAMNIPLRLTQREKRFILVGTIIVFLIIVYQIVSWYQGVRSSAREYVETKQLTLQRQINKILEKEEIEDRLKQVNSELNELEKGLLKGDKPPVAAAEIQKRLKALAQSLGIEIKSERTLNPTDDGLYIGIPVEIGFTASTAKLKDILYKIKTSPLLLTITKIRIRVTNIKNPVDVYATLVVKGFIKKPHKLEDKKDRSVS